MMRGVQALAPSALQQVALKVDFPKLAVEVQKTAPSGDGAEFA